LSREVFKLRYGWIQGRMKWTRSPGQSHDCEAL